MSTLIYLKVRHVSEPDDEGEPISLAQPRTMRTSGGFTMHDVLQVAEAHGARKCEVQVDAMRPGLVHVIVDRNVSEVRAALEVIRPMTADVRVGLFT